MIAIKLPCRLMLILSICLSLGGCDESDLTSIRVTLDADGSGTIRVSSVAMPAEPNAIERASTGAAWSNRVNINVSTGQFTSISHLVVGEITFAADVTDQGMGHLEVVVPLGPDTRWMTTILPMSDQHRAGPAWPFDYTGKVKSLGSALKVVIELPSDIVASGVTTEIPGVSASSKKNTATLTVPVDADMPGGDSIRWHLTWTQ